MISLRISRHEHLYESIEERLIRADELIADPVEAERKIGGSIIILCTVSMLSNPGLDNCGIYRLAPVERLIVDEASQIDSFEFMVSPSRTLQTVPRRESLTFCPW